LSRADCGKQRQARREQGKLDRRPLVHVSPSTAAQGESARYGVASQTSQLKRSTQSQKSASELISEPISILKLKPQPELEEARRFPWRVAGNRPEKRISHGRIRLPKARVIGEVEHIRPHFQPHAFLGHKRLVKGEIRVVDAVDPQAGKIARRVARILIAGVSEADRIEVGRRGRIPNPRSPIAEATLCMVAPGVLELGQIT
jgi:hypothetical protein